MSTKSETKVMTKGQIVDVLKKTIAVVADKNADLAKRVDYALTHMKKATKADLEDLMAEVKACVLTPVENQAKVLEEEEPENPEVVVEAEPEKEVKTTKKGKKKPVLHKKDNVETATPTTAKSKYLPIAKFFPEVIEHEDLGKLIAVPDKYHNYKELYAALEQGKTIYFACYWTKRHIKEYDYAGRSLVSAPKEFPHDLDLLVACVPCEKVERVWCMSQYTEAMFFFEGYDLEPVEDIDPKTDEKFMLRTVEGMEFELYVPEDEA